MHDPLSDTGAEAAVVHEDLLRRASPERRLALVLAWLASGVVLYFAGGMSRPLGERGLVAMERLMGMLLVTVAMEMLLGGLRQSLGR